MQAKVQSTQQSIKFCSFKKIMVILFNGMCQNIKRNNCVQTKKQSTVKVKNKKR